MRRLLCVGNSYTSRHRLPWLLADLAAAANPAKAMHVDAVVAGGASRRRRGNAGAAQRLLETAAWDEVVLQVQSTLPLRHRRRYHENARLFAAEIAGHGARPALYLTWARRDAQHAIGRWPATSAGSPATAGPRAVLSAPAECPAASSAARGFPAPASRCAASR